MAIKDLALSVAIKLKDELSKGLGKAADSVRGLGRASTQAGDQVGPFRKRVDKLADSGKKVGTAFKIARGAMVAFAGYVTGKVLGTLSGMTDRWAVLSAQIKLVTEDERELTKVRKQLLEVSNRTGSDIEASVALYTNLARSSEDLGLSQADLIGITETISQSMKVSGATAAESAGALRQLGQALASGTLRGDEFNSMNEQASRLMQALADNLGVGRGQLRAMAEAGELTAEKLIAAFQGQAEKISAEFEVLPKTFAGVFQSIRNDLLAFVGNTDKASGASTAAVQSIANGWMWLKTVITENGGAIVSVINGIGWTIDKVFRLLRVGINLVTIPLRTVLGLFYTFAYSVNSILSSITFGETSANFARDAENMRMSLGATVAGIVQDFEDLSDAASPAEEEMKKTGDAAQAAGEKLEKTGEATKKTGEQARIAGDAIDQAAEKFKSLSDQPEQELKVSANVDIDVEELQRKLQSMQQIADRNPIIVQVKTAGGTTGSEIEDEVMKRGDL